MENDIYQNMLTILSCIGIIIVMISFLYLTLLYIPRIEQLTKLEKAFRKERTRSSKLSERLSIEILNNKTIEKTYKEKTKEAIKRKEQAELKAKKIAQAADKMKEQNRVGNKEYKN